MVDLPAPFGPSRQKHSPLRMPRLMLFTAFTYLEKRTESSFSTAQGLKLSGGIGTSLSLNAT